MDETSHVSDVRFFHYLIHAMPLTDEEHAHLKECAECQAMLDQFDTYITPAMIDSDLLRAA